MEADWTYTEEGILCHRETSLELEPSKDNAEKEEPEGDGEQ
jgi:hypothetical protein